MSELVKEGQRLSIEFTTHGITVDGDRGPETDEQAVRVLQHAMNLDYGAGLEEDGDFGDLSNGALASHTVREGETQYMVSALEILLMLSDIDPKGYEYPGVFGSGCGDAVERYQVDHGLDVDRIAGRQVFTSLIGCYGYGGASSYSGGNTEGDGSWRSINPNSLENFDPTEFVCQCHQCGGDVCDELKQKAQALRNKIGQPMVITDGFRCEAWNVHEGGTSDSLHKCGMAFDFQVNGRPMSIDQMEQYRKYAHECGLTTGNYAEDGFMHCQIGRSDWNEDY